jgi:hypothetical protein
VPARLHKHLFMTGSLAAAYHYQAQLEGGAVNTKDVDLVVHPAGNVISCRKMTEKLLGIGWTPDPDLCYPCRQPQPLDDLRLIRLFPPKSRDYFIEFLNLPEQGQKAAKRLIPVELADGWYALASFRFMALAAIKREKSHVGLEYASPQMMALANLLSHRQIGTERIQTGELKGCLRSAKDLGRVLALAWLAGRDETEKWLPLWSKALRSRYPDECKELRGLVGAGLRELLADQDALEDAQKTTDLGLLSGMAVTAVMLKATGERLLQDVVEPLEFEGKKR